MGYPTDFCLLCQVNLASKTNSHIFPKFLSTNFLIGKENLRKGYELNSSSILDSKPKVIQDSPKEDYILCEECELYFSILEGIARDTFINWQTKVENGEFSLNRIDNELQIVECNTADKMTIHLFNYSIFWRVSVSGIALFKKIKITQNFEDELRKILLNYKQTKKNYTSKYISKKTKFQNFSDSYCNCKIISRRKCKYAFYTFFV